MLRLNRASPAALFALALAACGPALQPAGVASDAAITDPSAQVARSAVGMVSSATVWATEVGARVLAAGGNAADAAVAVSFALAVTEPSMSGLGGRTSIMIRTADGEMHGIDGLNQVPRGYVEGAPAGYDRAAIPGVPAAMDKLLRDHGTWPADRLLDPAVRLAEEGILLREDEAQRFAAAAEEMREHPGSRAAYLKPDGEPYAPGERLRQPALARTIRAMAEEGIGTFYRGWIADSIHADMVRNGGFITREELAAYEALPAIPAAGTYRGYGVHSNFRPASGHSVVQALRMMEEVGVPGPGSPAEWAAVVGQAMGLALADRAVRAGSEAESARRLTSPEHARERAREIRTPEEALEMALVPVGARAGSAAGDRAGARASGDGSEVAPWVAPSWNGPPWAPADREATTHFAVVDRDGMVVSVTQSLGPAVGTRLVTPGLGFLYATRLGSTPGSRPSSTISPTIVVRPDGTPYFALGGAGDARIVSAVIQVISRVIDHGLPLRDAVAAPRVHPGSEASGLFVETGPVAAWPDAVLERLRAHGFGLDPRDSGYFGRVHAVALEGDGFLGVAEPRWRGGAAGPRP